MPLTGDFAKLAKLGHKMGAVVTLPPQVATQLKGELMHQYQEDFAQQRAPTGAAWVADKDGHTPILYRTGDLANPNVIVTGLTLKVRPGPKYAAYHQGKRPILPAGSDAGVWQPPLEAAATRIVTEFFSSF